MANNSNPPVLNIYSVILIWLVLIGVCTVIFTKVIKDKNNPNQQLQIEFNENGDAEIVLKQNQQGHYLATGEINNHKVKFLVDTGATYVSVPEFKARELQLEKANEFESMTANGLTTSFYTTIKSIKLGAIEMKNVPASIATGMTFDEILLGMSFLKHFDLSQKQGELIIALPENTGN